MNSPRDIDRRRLLALGGCGVAAAAIASSDAAVATDADPFGGKAAVANRAVFNPLQFGAIGDGVADDTRFVQKAATAAQAAGGVLLIPAGHTFGTTRAIVVLDGTAGVTGGGTLKVLSSAQGTCGIVLAGRASGHAANVSNCVVEGITIDCNHKRALAIYGQNISHCKILRNSVLNCSTSGGGILVRSFIAGGASGRDNIIAFNDVRCDTVGTNHSVIGIQCDAQSDFSPYQQTLDSWKVIFRPTPAAYPALNDQIIGNTVVGGYYGIALQSTYFAKVIGNHCSLNTRCISAQNLCKGLLIQGNTLQDSISAGVHIAWGSIQNRIVKNKITTNRARGEALIQAYVGAKYNTFSENDVTITGGAPEYMAYCAVESDGCAFINNRFTGPVVHAYIGIESGWNGAVTDRASRAYGSGTMQNGFTHTGMGNIVISGNTIIGKSDVPAIYLGQISDAKGNYSLHDITVTNNTIVGGKHGDQLHLYEMTPGHLTIRSRKGNSFDQRAAASALALPLAAASSAVRSEACVADPGASLLTLVADHAPASARKAGVVVALRGHYAYVRTACQQSATRDIVWRLLHGLGQDLRRTDNRSGVLDFYGERFIDKTTPPTGTIEAFNASREIHSTGSDESAPTKFNSMFLGGNHGVIGYRVTQPSHGKTDIDVGSIYADGAERWVLSYIVSPSDLLFVRRYTGSVDGWNIPGRPPTGSILTHVSGGTHVDRVTFTSPTQMQLVPILRNYVLALSLDGRPLTADGDYAGDKLTISEHYSILNPASQQDSLVAHVGASRPDYTASDIAEQIRSFFEYSWNPWGAMTVRAVQGLRENFARHAGAPGDFWGVIQLQRVSALWSREVDLYIPDVSPVSGYDFRNKANITANAALVQVPAAACADPADPASHFCQIGRTGGAVTSSEAYGLSRASGLGVPATRAASVRNVMFFSPAEKQYPVAIDVAAGSGVGGRILTATAFRAPFLPTDASLTIPGVIVTMDGRHYGYITSHRSQTAKAVAVPAALRGLPIKVIKSDRNVTLHSNLVGRDGEITIDVAGSYGDVVLRIGA